MNQFSRKALKWVSFSLLALLLISLMPVSIVTAQEEGAVVDPAPEVVVTETTEALPPAEETPAPTSEEQIGVVAPTQEVGASTENVEGEILSTFTDTPSSDTKSSTSGTESTPTLPVGIPTLTTDKEDYHPGETATIFGKFFSPLQNFVLKIFGYSIFNGNSSYENNVTTDDSGSFVHAYQLEDVFRPDYTVQAFDLSGNLLAERTFTDAAGASVDIQQCDNGAIGATPVACDNPGNPNNHWGTGNVNGSKAHWQEGDFLPYRAIVVSPNPNVQRVTFSFDTAKSSESKHAIDYLSSYDLTETTGPANANHANQIDPCGDVIGTCDRLNEKDLSHPNGYVKAAIPVPTSLTTGYPSSCAGGSFSGTATEGYLKAWVSAGSISGLAVTQNTPSTSGDCEASFVIDYTLSQPATVVFAWSGHVAANNNPGSGGYWGAGNSVPTGSPYHMHAGFAPQYSGAVPTTCGTSIPKNQCEFNVGSQDLQLASSAILTPGTIVIVKNTVNSNGTFNYTTSGNGLSNFGITTVQNTGSQTFSNLAAGTPGGSRSFTETVPTGWALTGLTCVSANGQSTFNTNLGTGVATVSNLAAADTVTCTFTNTLQTGHIIVDKVTDPANDSQSFSFNTTGTGYNGFSLTHADNPNDQTLNAGNYSVSETVPAGWTQTSATCVSSLGQQEVETPANLELDPGETITCTFTNTKYGHIVVDKVTIPGGNSQSFSFDANGGSYADFALTDLAAANDQGLVPGNYTVAENTPTGWVLSNLVCTDPSQNSSVNIQNGTATLTLNAGETINCVFTNTELGSITVVKQTDPDGSNQSFNFTRSFGADFALKDGEQNVTSNLAEDVYTVAETVPSGWDLTSATCSDGSNPASINLAAGEDVTCTFTNTQKGKIIIEKQTAPDGSQASFGFTGEIVTSLTDGQTAEKVVTPGNYAVTESALAGWDLTGLTCNDGNSTTDLNDRTATFHVEAGETVTCVFTNTQRAHIIIQKNAIPDGNQVFTFENNFGNGNPASFNLTDDDTVGLPSYNAEVLPGKYAVSENPVTGWQLDGTSCDQDETVGDIDVAPGETVTCTFTNEKLAKIILVKHSLGGDASFHFNTTGTGLTPADLATVGGWATTTYDNINPDGTYSISEVVPEGWDLLSGTCNNGDAVNNITPNAGEIITCTFTNEKDSFIIVEKQTLPNLSQVSFEFDTTYGPNFNLTNGQQNNSGDLTPGTYSVDELTPNGWDETSAVCTSSNVNDVETAGTISLQAGETVTCVFTNTQRGSITVNKDVVAPDGVTPYEDDTAFTVNLNGGNTQNNLSETNPVNYLNLVPGNYTVTEDPVTSGYTLVSTLPDSDGNVAGAQVEVLPGQNTVVNVVNKLDKIDTNIITSASSQTVVLGGQITDTATVSGADPQIQLTGSVTFFVCQAASCPNEGTQVGNPIPVVNGQAVSDPFTPITPGVYTFRAVYSGDANYNGSIDLNANGLETFTIVVPLNVSKTAFTNFTRTFTWDIEKSVDKDTWNMFVGDTNTSNYTVKVTKGPGVDSDWQVSGVINITNPNATISATITSVSDIVTNQGAATVVCPFNFPHVLAPLASEQCTYSLDATDGDDETNNVTVATSGSIPGNTANAAVDFGEPSTVINDKINVNDTFEGNLGEFSTSGQTTYDRQFSCSEENGNIVGAGIYGNTATIVETGDSDDVSVTVSCYELQVTKTADTSFDRTYTWGIQKTGDKDSLTLAPDQTFPVNYTVTVSKTGSTDSNHKVTGTIKVTNPAPVAATLNSVSDSITGVGAVTVDCGVSFPYEIAAGSELNCTYSSDLPNADSRTNTAVATLANTSGTTDFDGSANVQFSTTPTNEIDECTQVVDDNGTPGNTSDDTVKGIACVTDTLPKVFDYTLNVGPYTIEKCGVNQAFVNTATFTTVDDNNDTDATGSDNHTVNVNVQCVCSLTQGYWKTHNTSFKGGAPADPNWFNVDFDGNNGNEGEDETFFLSGATWFDVFWTAPKGNPYYNLAHQYMAARLNISNGASGGAAVTNAVTQATALFTQYSPTDVGKKSNLKKQFTDFAGILGAFNEGLTNPAGHCSEPPQ